MASKLRFTDDLLKRNPSLAKFGHYYNIDSAVGVNGANKPDDVMLVQFMLNTWMNSSASPFLCSGGPMPMTAIPQDGKFDLTTLAYLVIFQMHRSGFIDVTGKADPLTPHNMEFGGTTMTVLNIDLWSSEPQLYKDFTTGKNFPASLRQAIK
jgi:hypothetical protein